MSLMGHRTDQPHVRDLVTYSVVFPEACLSLTEFLLKVARHSLEDNAQHYLAGMWDKCNSSIVLAVNFFPFIVDRYIDISSKFCRPLSFSNYLIAHVCQLCHRLTVIIDGLDKLDIQIVRTGCFIVVDMSDKTPHLAKFDIVKKKSQKTKDNKTQKRSKSRRLARCMHINIYAMIAVELGARG